MITLTKELVLKHWQEAYDSEEVNKLLAIAEEYSYMPEIKSNFEAAQHSRQKMTEHKEKVNALTDKDEDILRRVFAQLMALKFLYCKIHLTLSEYRLVP